MTDTLENKASEEKEQPMVEAVMPLDTLANICGYFFNCCLTAGYEDKPAVNNGYNCSHPDVGEEQEGVGCCLGSACPLGYQADGLTRCKQCQTCEECGNEGCECDDDLMVVSIPEDKFDPRYMELVQPEAQSDAKTGVSLMDAVNGIKGQGPSMVWVRFCYINDMGKKVRQKDIRLSALYKDWYGECEHCPANDTPITGVHVRTADGVKFALTDTDIEFGDFMDTLEANFKFRRPRTES